MLWILLPDVVRGCGYACRRRRRRRQRLLLQIVCADLGLGLGVRVLSGQHFPVEFGRGRLETGYLGRDRRRRRVRGSGRRVMMKRIAPSADRPVISPGGRGLRRIGPGGRGFRRIDPGGRGFRLRGTIMAAAVVSGVRLSGARHRHRDGWFRVRRRIGRTPDVLERRFRGHADVVRPRLGRHAYRNRPDGRRPGRLSADVCRRWRRRRRHGHCPRCVHYGGRPGVGDHCGLSVRHRGGCLYGVLGLSVRRRRGRLGGGVRLGVHCRPGRRPFRHCGRVHGGGRRCGHSHVPAHGYTVDAHLFGGHFGVSWKR